MSGARPPPQPSALALAVALAALAALAALTALTARAAQGEPLYVVEQLVVNVNSAPDASGERIATVKSGDRVEELERLRDEVHVRLADGKDGWIRASYLSAEEPLRARLAQRDSQVAQLQQDVERLQAQLAAAHTPSASTAPAPGGTTRASSAAASPAEDPAVAPPAPPFTVPVESPLRLWPWTLGAALLGAAFGFALGALVLDRHIRRKYGGLRIY